MKKLIVGMGDMKVSSDPSCEVITYALGSCIGVAVHDTRVGVGGIIHYMLPESKLNPDKASANPFMFADSGMPIFFKEMFKLGASKRNMVIKLAGGANVLDASERFNIGKRNYMMIRKLLWKNHLMISGECVGGTTNRTLRVDLSTGQIMVREAQSEFKEL